MSEAFGFTTPPFDRLTPAERERIQACADLAFFPKGTVVLTVEDAAEHLHMVVRGLVQEVSGSEVMGAFGPGEAFDSRSLLTELADPREFIAREDTVCQLLPRAVFLDLVHTNPGFGGWFHRDLVERISNAALRKANREMTSFMMARIRQSVIHPAAYIDAGFSAHDAVAAMKEVKATSLLVRDGDRVGIISDRDLRDAVILEGKPITTPVGPLASYGLITLDIDDFLFNALIVMTRHDIRRVVITEGDDIVGILEQVDLLGFLANNSHLVAIRIERATSIPDLRQASGDISGLIQALHVNGVKVALIAEMVTALNRRIFRKLFDLLAPPDLAANSCLIVMGSEGRGEQILKTDQDNGLILRDGYDCPDLDTVVQRFSQALIDFGYPECPGRIMVNNPEWTRSLSDYKKVIHRWIHHTDEASFLNLAIFYDAAAVAGDTSLLDEARDYLHGQMTGNNIFLAYFAKPTLSFATPITFFSNFKGEQIDIKKGGIFPLVHGVRSLTLEKRMTENNTFDRIRALQRLGVLNETLAEELSEALSVMLDLRLKLRVAAGQVGTQTDNFIRPDELNRMDRDLLKDALAIVKRFKEFISHHFRLNMM